MLRIFASLQQSPAPPTPLFAVSCLTGRRPCAKKCVWHAYYWTLDDLLEFSFHVSPANCALCSPRVHRVSEQRHGITSRISRTCIPRNTKCSQARWSMCVCLPMHDVRRYDCNTAIKLARTHEISLHASATLCPALNAGLVII